MPKFAHHPARLAALAAGEKKWHGPQCRRHGDAPHHTSSGQCVPCNRERSARQAIEKSSRRERYVKLADRPERLAALARGAHIYWGPLCLNGHAGKRANLSPRYTRSTHCVACAQARPKNQCAAEFADRAVVGSLAVADARPRQADATNDVSDRARQIIRRTAQGLHRLIRKTR